MALLAETEIFVAVEQRLDGAGGRGTRWPYAYVRLSLDGDRTNMSPSTARQLAKALKFYADLADPPQKRKRS